MVQNLIPNDSYHLEALLAAYRVDDHVSMNSNEVFAIQYRVFILTGCVNDLYSIVLIPISDDLAEGVLNGWVVRVYEMTLDVLHSQGTLACGKLASLSTRTLERLTH